MKIVTDYEEAVKKIIPKHHISINHEKLQLKEINGQRKLKVPTQVQRKDYQDVWFGFHPIIHTNGFGIYEHTVLITGCPDNLHPGTGKPK